MRKKNKQNLKSEFSLFLIMFISLFFVFFNFFTKTAKTDTDDNTEGYAWNSNIGWISFNCTNNDTCGTSDYGVKIIPATMNFTGYAWSPNVGWISFQSTSTPPDSYAFNTNCDNTCDNFTNCTACYDIVSGNVWGWAKILSMGDGGWIRLHASGTPTYDGVSINQSNGEFEGWGWNGNDDGSGIGWISFNCLETANCATSDYRVYATNINFPEAIDLNAPNWSWDDACTTGEAKHGFLNWSFYDKDASSSQSAYQVRVSTQNSTTTGVVLDSGKVFSNGTQYYMASSTDLDYDTSYYWFVMVWDDFGFESGWTPFDTINGTSTHTLTDNIARNNAVSPDSSLTFTTYTHEFPIVDFSWDPEDPVKDEDVIFTDESVIYSAAAPSTTNPCTEGTCSWLWGGSGIRTISTTTASSSTMTFDYGYQSVDLEVTDDDGYACSSTEPIYIDLYPDWREVKPEN